MLLTSVHRRLWVGKFVFCSINPNESLSPKKRVSQIGNIIESKENGFSSLEKGTLFRKPWRRMKKSWLACKIHICTKDALFASHCSCGKTFFNRILRQNHPRSFKFRIEGKNFCTFIDHGGKIWQKVFLNINVTWCDFKRF